MQHYGDSIAQRARDTYAALHEELVVARGQVLVEDAELLAQVLCRNVALLACIKELKGLRAEEMRRVKAKERRGGE